MLYCLSVKSVAAEQIRQTNLVLDILAVETELVRRRFRSSGLKGMGDVVRLYPGLQRYWGLVAKYERLCKRADDEQTLTERSRGSQAAAYLRAARQRHERRAFRTIARFAQDLSLGCMLYEILPMMEAIAPDATLETRCEVFSSIGWQNALEDRLQKYRLHRLREREALDLGVLWEALVAAGPSVEEGIASAVRSLREGAEAGTYFAALKAVPLQSAVAFIKNARSILRTAYEAEAPERLVDSLSDEPHEPADRRPTPEQAFVATVEREDRRARRRAAERALCAQVKAAQLTPVQVQVVAEYWKALRKGFRLSGKQSNSLRSYWGADEYSRKQRTLNRVRQAIPDLLKAIEDVATMES